MTRRVELCSHPSLDPRVNIVRAGTEVDAIVVRTRRFVALIDTLCTPEQCQQALQLLGPELAGRPLLVINSHMDWDHYWGNQVIAARAPIIAHSASLARLRDPSAAKTLHDKSRKESRFDGIELVGPTVTFDGSLTLSGGDLTLELIHTPGHAPDHISVWIPELKLCLAVDTLEEPIPVVWSTQPEDLALLLSSIRHIRGLGARMILPAHGQTCDPGLADRNLAYFDELANRVGELAVDDLLSDELPHRPGFVFDDLVKNVGNLAEPDLAVYRAFHVRNLAATAAARIADLARGQSKLPSNVSKLTL